VSHELRTPLTAILGWLHLLRNDTLPVEKRARALEVIERNARSQAQVIEDLLDVGRIVSGKMAIETEPTDVTTVAAMAVEGVRPLADAKGVRIDASFGPGRCVVAGDPQRLQQIVWNLLSNAVKFTPAGGEIWMAIERIGEQVEIRVRDTGIGIAPEFLPAVFERFRQAEGGTKRKMGGLGLGLSIVRSLVEAHGGYVRAYSEGPSKGSLFVVRIPALSQHWATGEREKDQPPEALSTRMAASLDGMHVLVVDDESDTREYLRNLLEHAQARVSEAATAREALEALRETHPDVLVSDIGLVGSDGNALIRRVRNLTVAEGGTTPAVALTAHVRDEDRVRSFVAGFQRYVTKPVEPAELLNVLTSLRRGYRGKHKS
jgi:light-regulated signal transduction histidine kinase (bacteriophytochrome)